METPDLTPKGILARREAAWRSQVPPWAVPELDAAAPNWRAEYVQCVTVEGFLSAELTSGRVEVYRDHQPAPTATSESPIRRPQQSKSGDGSAWLGVFLVLLVVGLLGSALNGHHGSGSGRPSDIPGGIQWSQVHCEFYSFGGDQVEMCEDNSGNSVSPDTAHGYGIRP